jgi:hypothetical protein
MRSVLGTGFEVRDRGAAWRTTEEINTAGQAEFVGNEFLFWVVAGSRVIA